MNVSTGETATMSRIQVGIKRVINRKETNRDCALTAPFQAVSGCYKRPVPDSG